MKTYIAEGKSVAKPRLLNQIITASSIFFCTLSVNKVSSVRGRWGRPGVERAGQLHDWPKVITPKKH